MDKLKKEFIKRFLDANEDDGYHIFIDEQDCNDVWNWIAENLTPKVSRVELPVKPACEHKNKRYVSYFLFEEIYCRDCDEYLGQC